MQNENFICKINKTSEEIKEVIIGKKPTTAKYGNLNLNHATFSTDGQKGRPKYKKLTCATKIINTKFINITFYNFCIYEKTNNSPFNFQIYNDKDGLPNQVIYNQYIKNYKKGWNRIAVEDVNLSLKPGTYYIAIQWMPMEDKSDVWIYYKDNERVIYAIGQILGINKGDENQLESFIFRDNGEQNPRLYTGKKGNYTQYIEVFEN